MRHRRVVRRLDELPKPSLGGDRRRQIEAARCRPIANVSNAEKRKPSPTQAKDRDFRNA
jgi:hypothetical protein